MKEEWGTQTKVRQYLGMCALYIPHVFHTMHMFQNIVQIVEEGREAQEQ